MEYDSTLGYRLASHANDVIRYQAVSVMGGSAADRNFYYKAMLEKVREMRKLLDVYEMDLALAEFHTDVDEQVARNDAAKELEGV